MVFVLFCLIFKREVIYTNGAVFITVGAYNQECSGWRKYWRGTDDLEGAKGDGIFKKTNTNVVLIRNSSACSDPVTW